MWFSFSGPVDFLHQGSGAVFAAVSHFGLSVMGTKEKPPCEFGAKCYRKNPRHLESYSHPNKTNEPVDAEETVGGVNVRNNTRPVRTKMKQTTLTFPDRCEFSSAPKTQPSVWNKKKLNVKNTKKEPALTKFKDLCNKNNVNESVRLKRKRKTSISENSKSKVKILKHKTKSSSCFKSNDSSVESVESNEGSDCDSGAVQSTSWTFIRNSSIETENPLNLIDLEGKTTEEIIKTLCLVDMPADFYCFYEFCKSVNESLPLEAFHICDLNLVGPFDILAGKMNSSVDKELFLCHWRYYYDPPEFQTVLAKESGFHIGYWRDDPKESPVFLASNNPERDCIFKIEAENIFGTLFNYLDDFIKSCDPFKKVKVKKLQNALSDWAKKNEFSLDMKTSKMNERQKKVVSKTFHGAGIVVPVQPESKVGYRPLIETDANLKRICKLIMDANDEGERELLWENLQPLVAAANIANDECDFGNSLELGIDLFCTGSSAFHETVEHLLSTAYTLLERTEFETIIKAHLKLRRKGNHLSMLNKI